MFSTSYPEKFFTINMIEADHWQLIIAGATFLFLFIIQIKWSWLAKKTKQLFNLNILWSSAFIVWFIFFGLNQTFAWLGDISVNDDLFNKPTIIRQNARFCDALVNQTNIGNCQISAIHQLLDRHMARGEKIYYAPSFTTVSMYLHYYLNGMYQVVTNPDQADFFLVAYPVKLYQLKNNLLLENNQDQEIVIGKYKLVDQINHIRLFVREK